MYEKSVKVTNKVGIHARPAAAIVMLSNKFKADVTIIKEEMEVNGKSIMGIMMLAIGPGSEITIRGHGIDENDVVEALVDLIQKDFHNL